MLPRPVASRQPIRRRSSRLTILILSGVLVLSLVANLSQWARARATATPHHNPSQRTQFPYDSSLHPLRNMSHLVIVAGHAVFQGCVDSEWQEEKNWVLQEHQKGTSSVQAFYTHITNGVSTLRADPNAILIFSGGVTRRESHIQSEGQSYLKLALANNLLDQSQARARTFTEDYALDSFQNLLFSIARFHELSMASGIPDSDAWPSKITVVGFEMKRRRFVELHRQAIKWPESRFQYIGVDFMDAAEREKGWQGESQHGYQPYTQDLYGCHGELASKRTFRNPYARFHPYYTTNPELAPLFDWCPSVSSSIAAQVYPGRLPWN